MNDCSHSNTPACRPRSRRGCDSGRLPAGLEIVSSLSAGDKLPCLALQNIVQYRPPLPAQMAQPPRDRESEEILAETAAAAAGSGQAHRRRGPAALDRLFRRSFAASCFYPTSKNSPQEIAGILEFHRTVMSRLSGPGSYCENNWRLWQTPYGIRKTSQEGQGA